MKGFVLPRLALGALLTACGIVLGAQTPEHRLVAIGDIHGAYDNFHAVLQQANLVDETGAWVGSRTTFVQTGDYMDRGRDVRAVMDLLRRIEEEADDDGGRAEVLLGNHETMNLMVNVRDVTPEIFATFATDESAEHQRRAYDAYRRHVAARTEALGRPLPNHQSEEAWLASHPVGFVEYVEALGPDGDYGRWLRSRPIAVRIHDTVFLHGGLSLEHEAASVNELNERAADEIARFDSYRAHLIDRGVILPTTTFQNILTAVALELQAWVIRLFPGPPDPTNPPALSPDDRDHLDILFEVQALGDWSVIHEDGPLWSRDFARWSDEEGQAAVPALLERFGVRRAVVGHTVTPSRRIQPRFDGQVFLIDTGMLSEAYQGRASALELGPTGATAIYLDERIQLTDNAL